MLASSIGDVDVMKIILKNTPSFDIQKMYDSVKNDNLETIINQETRHFLQLVKSSQLMNIIEMMHPLQVKDLDGMTALMYAVKNNHTEATKLLLSMGAQAVNLNLNLEKTKKHIIDFSQKNIII